MTAVATPFTAGSELARARARANAEGEADGDADRGQHDVEHEAAPEGRLDATEANDEEDREGDEDEPATDKQRCVGGTASCAWTASDEAGESIGDRAGGNDAGEEWRQSRREPRSRR